MQKMRWFGAVRGHSRSWAMPLFDRAHTTSYSTLMVTMRLSCTFFRDIASYLSKVADFDPPHLQLAPPQGVIPVEFRSNFAEIFDVRKLRSWAIVWRYLWGSGHKPTGHEPAGQKPATGVTSPPEMGQKPAEP